MKYERLTICMPNGECRVSETKFNSEEAKQKAINRLAELEDKIEDGTLIELPCKIGDTVYRLHGKCAGDSCPYNGEYGQWRCLYKGKRRCDAFVDEIPFNLSNLSDIGKHIFLTREEAEARLKKLTKK